MIQKITSILISFVLCISLQAQTVKELQAEQAKLQEELKQTQQMLNQTKKNEKATNNKLNILNQNIKTRTKLINGINKEINALDGEIVTLGEQRNQLQDELEKLKQDYANLTRKTHYAKMKQSPLLFLLSSKDFQQLVRRIRYMRQIARYREMQVRMIENTQADIDIHTALLQDRKTEREEALKSEKREQENLARDKKKQKKMLEELKKEEKKLAQKQKKQQKKVDELNKKIDEIIRSQATKSTLTAEQQLISGGFEKNKGRLPWPVEKGFISGQFGQHQHPVYEHVTINNKGIYIQTVAGSMARAIYEGEVTSCIVLGNNYAVIVQHGNYRTVYSNLKELSVKQGDKVVAKQALGKIYSDPEEDNKTEVYFQIYKDRTLLDPTPWLAQ